MSESLPQFRLGIIGGCMSHQLGLPFGALYHRQLASMLRADPQVQLRVSIAREFTLDPASRLEHLMSETALDGVLVHLREWPLVKSSRLLLTPLGGVAGTRLHPATFHRNHDFFRGRHRGSGEDTDAYGRTLSESDWASVSDAEDSGDGAMAAAGDVAVEDRLIGGRRIAGFRLRNVNYFLGSIAGLAGWAIEDELLRLDDLARVCRERGVPLFVLGPVPLTYTYWATRLAKTANVRIRRRLRGSDIGFALIERTTDLAGHPLTGLDGFHRTVEGHRFVAEQLYDQGMRDWVGRIVGASRRLSVPR